MFMVLGFIDLDIPEFSMNMLFVFFITIPYDNKGFFCT